MKILDNSINSYMTLEELNSLEDLKDLPIYKRKPKTYMGFYILEAFDDIANQIIWTLRERCID